MNNSPETGKYYPHITDVCPVLETAKVDVIYADGTGVIEVPAFELCWNHTQRPGDRIIKYRISSLETERKHSHYFKDVSKLSEIDVYQVCRLFEVQDSSGALHHAIKKLLCSGKRGAKDRAKDIQEAIDTLKRLQEIEA